MTRRERQRRRRKYAHPARRAVFVVIGVFISGFCVSVALAAIWVFSTANGAPNINDLSPRSQGQTTEIFASNGKPLGYLASDVLRTTLPESKQPELMRKATVAIEDRRFYQHGGVDYQGLARAIAKDVFEGGGIQGGSTLTMQLITNVYLPTDIEEHHNLKYKIIQAKLANELESTHSKNWILTQYLNDVPYGSVGGQTAIGIAAASRMFFDKPVQDLDLAQVALLAGLPQAPTSYNPFKEPTLATWRRGLVLQAMLQSGYITKRQEQAANSAPLGVHANDYYGSISQPYVVDYVRQQLIQDFGQQTVDEGGLKVYTTINLADQAAAATAIKENEDEPGDPASSLVSVNPANGHILALQNSTTYGTGKGQTVFDYATQGQRQTGSAFKPFVLMTLIKDQDGDPNDTYYNSAALPAGWLPSYPTYSVHNAEAGDLGPISVTRATALSVNAVYAQLGVDLGMSNVDNTATAMGITSPLFGYPSEAIGGLKIGVSALQMANSYATLADGGVHLAPTIISYVVKNGQRVDPSREVSPTRVFTPGQAYAGTQTLKTVLQYGTGTGANYGCPAAGKTGTTSNYTDAWFVGYTPQLSTAVWVGYPNSDVYMNDVNGLGPGYGGTLAAPIWKDFMQSASHGYCNDFPVPAAPWHGIEYFGKHAVSAYVPPPPPVATTTATETTTTPAGTGGGAVSAGGTASGGTSGLQPGAGAGAGNSTGNGTQNSPATGNTPAGNTPPTPPSANGGGGF
jgi:penicillin-binding protein 1A